MRPWTIAHKQRATTSLCSLDGRPMIGHVILHQKCASTATLPVSFAPARHDQYNLFSSDLLTRIRRRRCVRSHAGPTATGPSNTIYANCQARSALRKPRWMRALPSSYIVHCDNAAFTGAHERGAYSLWHFANALPCFIGPTATAAGHAPSLLLRLNLSVARRGSLDTSKETKCTSVLITARVPMQLLNVAIRSNDRHERTAFKTRLPTIKIHS